MTEPEYFCPQCGPLRCEDPIQAIDEDGCCQSCGATTCTWPDLVEHLKDEGFELVRDKLTDPGHPMGWCRHDGFSHTRNVECPRKLELEPRVAPEQSPDEKLSAAELTDLQGLDPHEG